jgi:hypothetical protein
VRAETPVEIYASEDQLVAIEEYILRAYDLGLVPVGDAASMMAEGIVLGDAELYTDGMNAYLHALDSLSEEERDQL